MVGLLTLSPPRLRRRRAPARRSPGSKSKSRPATASRLRPSPSGTGKGCKRWSTRVDHGRDGRPRRSGRPRSERSAPWRCGCWPMVGRTYQIAASRPGRRCKSGAAHEHPSPPDRSAVLDAVVEAPGHPSGTTAARAGRAGSGGERAGLRRRAAAMTFGPLVCGSTCIAWPMAYSRTSMPFDATSKPPGHLVRMLSVTPSR